MEIGRSFLNDIKNTLMRDYPEEEVAEMLSKATFYEDRYCVVVTYDNGICDTFWKETKTVLQNIGQTVD